MHSSRITTFQYIKYHKLKQYTRVVFSCLKFIWGPCRIQIRTRQGVDSSSFSIFYGYIKPFCESSSQVWIDKMIQYTLHKVRLIDKLFQASCINEIFIYLIVCLPVEANICSLDGNIQKLHYEMMANISSQLCSMKSGDIFFAGQTTRGREQ